RARRGAAARRFRFLQPDRRGRGAAPRRLALRTTRPATSDATARTCRVDSGLRAVRDPVANHLYLRIAEQRPRERHAAALIYRRPLELHQQEAVFGVIGRDAQHAADAGAVDERLYPDQLAVGVVGVERQVSRSGLRVVAGGNRTARREDGLLDGCEG